MTVLRESGASALTIALALILLLGAAAIAIDVGAGFNERRQDQTASDLAAVAGALSFGDNDAIVDQVMAVARDNLDSQYTDPDWISAWTNCTDLDRPLGFTPVNHSTLGLIDCVSVNPSFVRVRLPDQTVDATFGRILGVEALTTNADTIVTLLDEGGAGSLPFAVRGNSDTGEICLDTSTGSKIVPPCDGNEQGSFGNIAPPLFGSPILGTTPSCGQQTSANNYVPESIAMGIDHIIWTFPQASWTATGWDPDDNTSNNNVDAASNMDECTDTGGEFAEAADGVPVNSVYVDTGNNVKADITEGLITATGFADGQDARLTRSVRTRDVDGYSLDDVPLWDHLGDASFGSNPEDNHGIAACDQGQVEAAMTADPTSAAMRACLVAYQTGSYSTQIFSDSILNSPRLGIAPRLWHNNLGTGISYRPVRRFDIVYIHAIWFDDKDDTVFYPGESGGGPISLSNWKEVEQVTAFLLSDSMVSSNVLSVLGGFSNGTFQPTIFE